MPTNLDIDDRLLNKAKLVGGIGVNIAVDTLVWSLALGRDMVNES